MLPYCSRLQVECNSLAIEFGSNFEPYYCSLALYDMCGEGNGKPVKISADFKFELNSPALMTTIMDGYGQDPILQLKKCIFTLDSANVSSLLFCLSSSLTPLFSYFHALFLRSLTLFSSAAQCSSVFKNRESYSAWRYCCS